MKDHYLAIHISSTLCVQNIILAMRSRGTPSKPERESFANSFTHILSNKANKKRVKPSPNNGKLNFH